MSSYQHCRLLPNYGSWGIYDFYQLPAARIVNMFVSLKRRSRKRLMPSSKNKLHSKLNATYLLGKLFFSRLIFSPSHLSKAQSRQRSMLFFGNSKTMSIHPLPHWAGRHGRQSTKSADHRHILPNSWSVQNKWWSWSSLLLSRRNTFVICLTRLQGMNSDCKPTRKLLKHN